MKKLRPFPLILPLAIVMALSAACSTIRPDKTADTLYIGGEILTMNGDPPNYAEAVAVKDGKIVGIGERQAIENTYKGSDTKIADLGGKTLIPGFVDAHGHVFNVGAQALAANLMGAPDGEVKDIASLQQKLSAWAKGKISD